MRLQPMIRILDVRKSRYLATLRAGRVAETCGQRGAYLLERSVPIQTRQFSSAESQAPGGSVSPRVISPVLRPAFESKDSKSKRNSLPVHHSQGHIHEFAPRIVVIGVGGAGGNAVNNMISRDLKGVDFFVCNTDAQHLSTCLTENRLRLGGAGGEGLGCGANPDVGRNAALESKEEVLQFVRGAHMVFITAGMGGGTGTGGAPVIAEACKESGILTVAVVTKPFRFEGTHRMRLAEEGLVYMRQATDTLIVLPNQNLFKLVEPNTSLVEAFSLADNVLLSGVRSISDLMVTPGLVNLDFADVQAIMADMGAAMMGTGEAEGENRAVAAAELALHNPLLGDVSVASAKGLLVNIAGGSDLTLHEVDAAITRITAEVQDEDANIIFGGTNDSSLNGRIRVSLVATGIDESREKNN